MSQHDLRTILVQQSARLERQERRIQTLEQEIVNLSQRITEGAQLNSAYMRHATSQTSELVSDLASIRSSLLALEGRDLLREETARKKESGCLVLLAAGLSAFSLFTTYQI